MRPRLIRFPSCCCATRAPCRSPGDAPEGFGIWQTWTWQQTKEEIQAFAVGLKAARRRPRRHGCHRSATTVRTSIGRSVRRRASAPSRFPFTRTPSPKRWPTSSSHAEVRLRDRRGPGAGRQGPVRLPSGCRARCADHLRRCPRAAASTTRRTCARSRASRRSAARRSSQPRRRAGVARRGRRGQGQRRQRHALHVRHHRAAEGRDADPRERRRLRRNGNIFDHFTPDDTMLAYLPMAWVGDHIFSYGQAFAGALCVALPREPGDGDRGSPRDRADLLLRPAARVREHADRRSWCAWRMRARSRSAMFHYFLERRAALRRANSRWPAGGVRRPLALWARRRAGLCARCATAWAFPTSRVAYTAGEAIGPELFSFFRSLGINLKQLYGQTEASVFITLQPNGEVYPDTVGKPGPGRRDQNRRQRRGAVQEPRRVPEVLQERRGDRGDQDGRRLGPYRRRRLHRPARPLRIIDRAKDVGR